jgi:hypothetical protein
MIEILEKEPKCAGMNLPHSVMSYWFLLRFANTLLKAYPESVQGNTTNQGWKPLHSALSFGWYTRLPQECVKAVFLAWPDAVDALQIPVSIFMFEWFQKIMKSQFVLCVYERGHVCQALANCHHMLQRIR